LFRKSFHHRLHEFRFSVWAYQIRNWIVNCFNRLFLIWRISHTMGSCWNCRKHTHILHLAALKSENSSELNQPMQSHFISFHSHVMMMMMRITRAMWFQRVQHVIIYILLRFIVCCSLLLCCSFEYFFLTWALYARSPLPITILFSIFETRTKISISNGKPRTWAQKQPAISAL
jgi:hypothetical protein